MMEEAVERKVLECFKNNTLVGYVVLSREELLELYKYIGPMLRSFNNERDATISHFYDRYVFVAIVNAIKTWDCDEGRFWDSVTKEIASIEHSQKLYKYYIDLIDSLSKNGIIKAVKSYGHNYYATVCCQALSPKKSLYSFFDMCWSIYCNDFDFTSGNAEDISFIAESLKMRFEKNTNETLEFSLGSDVYSILVGIRGLCVDHLDAMKDLLTETFKLIDKRFNEKPIENYNYLCELINGWWKEKQSELGTISRRSASTRGRVVSDYSRINARYILEDNEAYLYLPPFRLKDNIYDIPYLSIYSGNNCIYSQELNTRGSGLMMATMPFTFNVAPFIHDNSIRNLRIEVEHSGKVIYNSRNSLHREFLLFKNIQEILASDTIPGNYSLFVDDVDSLVSYPSSLSYISGCRYVFSSNEGDTLQKADKLIIFREEGANKSIFRRMNIQNNVVFLCGEKEYSVIDGNLKIVVDSSINPNSIGVRYDGNAYKLTDFTSSNRDSYKEYNVSENIFVGEPKEIQIFDYASNKSIMICNIIKFKNIHIDYDKPLYYDLVDNGTLRFKTEKYDEKATFTIYDQEVAINLDTGKLVFTPPIFRWRFEGGEWNVTCVEAYWYKKIANNSKLEISFPVGFEGYVFVTDSMFSNLESCSENEYRLGEKLYELADEKSSPLVSIVCKCNNTNDILPLANVYLSETYKNDMLMVSFSDKLYWRPEGVFIGDENKAFSIKLYHLGEEVFQVKAGTQNQEFDIEGLLTGRYEIRVFAISGGFLNKTETLVNESEFIIGEEKFYKYEGKLLSIKSVKSLDCDEPYILKDYYIDGIEYIGVFDDVDYYSGKLCQITSGGRKTYISSIKLQSGYMERVNPVRLEFKDDSSFWMVYGLNKDDVDDFSGEFTLSSKRQLTIQSHDVKAIDYYNFKVEE